MRNGRRSTDDATMLVRVRAAMLCGERLSGLAPCYMINPRPLALPEQPIVDIADLAVSGHPKRLVMPGRWPK